MENSKYKWEKLKNLRERYSVTQLKNKLLKKGRRRKTIKSYVMW